MIKLSVCGVALAKGYHGAKQRAYLKAYGKNYDFCRFFTMYNDKNDIIGSILVFNSAMTIAFCDSDKIEYDIDEIKELIELYRPASIETPLYITANNYVTHKIDSFRYIKKAVDIEKLSINPSPYTLKEIVAESFEGVDASLWYTDVSHRIRHGVSAVFSYKRSVAVVDFVHNGVAYISSFCTKQSDRGQGSAEKLLMMMSKYYSSKNIVCGLFADDDSRGYYKHLGLEKLDKINNKNGFSEKK